MATTGNRTNELRALLLGGEETDRELARGRLSDPVLVMLSQRLDVGKPGESGVDMIELDARYTWAVEVGHLAVAVHELREQIAGNLEQLRAIVNDLAPHLTRQHGVGPIKAAEIIIDSLPPRAD